MKSNQGILVINHQQLAEALGLGPDHEIVASFISYDNYRSNSIQLKVAGPALPEVSEGEMIQEFNIDSMLDRIEAEGKKTLENIVKILRDSSPAQMGKTLKMEGIKNHAKSKTRNHERNF